MKRILYVISMIAVLLLPVACGNNPEEDINALQTEDKKEDFGWLIGDWIFTTDIIKGYHLSFKDNGDYFDDISHNNPNEGLTKKGVYRIIKTKKGIDRIEARNPEKDYIYCYEILKHDDSSMDVFFYLEYYRGPREGEQNHNMDLSLRRENY